MTLLVKNERDIINANIRYHLANGVDFIIATDNGSSDGTREILADYQQAGALRLIDEPGNDFSQDQWVTRMALLARDKHGADWIINSDADEFWRYPGGSLKDGIVGCTEPIQLCHRHNLFNACDSLLTGPWFNDLIYRVVNPIPPPMRQGYHDRELRQPYFSYRLPQKAIIAGPGLVSVTQGNHGAIYESTVSQRVSAIAIYHFPVRNRVQFLRKIKSGGEAYSRNTRYAESIGWHWRRFYRVIQQDGIHSALAEAVPTMAQIQLGLDAGEYVEDRTFFHDYLALLRHL
ncbi:Glycosyl transferase family 2 [Allochromatium warmingii]|uniref:Glycosyl transferase family 2 n=2 Tax=Allochromatium warmingii TaxID=61595 RepID=A0A1H3JV90_ALLWA|nr:Glycosyl transferase family 2 [Allochromatium warmingii]